MGEVKVSKRSAATAAAPAAAINAKRSAKRVKAAANGAGSREERFVSKLAAALQLQNARPREASQVREALQKAVSLLPDTKALKRGLLDSIDTYAALLCRCLGVTEADANETPLVEASRKEKTSSAATSGSAYDLLLEPCYEREMLNLSCLSFERKQQLLMARGPAPVDLIRSCMGDKKTSVEVLEHAICIWSSLTPVSVREQRQGGVASHWEEVASLAKDALREADVDQEKIAQVSKLLSRLFGAQAVRKRRRECNDETSGDVEEPNGAGDLLLVRAQVMAVEEANRRRCENGAVPAGALVPAIVRDLRTLGQPALHRLVDLLLEPQLPLAIGAPLLSDAEELIWQASYQAIEAYQTRPHSFRPEMCPGAYIKRILLHKRGMARAANRAGAKAASHIFQLCKRILPPRALQPWLQRQPQNHVVATALAALESQPKDLTAHLLMRSSESEVRQLLKLWQTSLTHEVTREEARAVGEVSVPPAVGTDDDLFFLDTAGTAGESAFGRDWGDDADAEEEEEEEEEEENSGHDAGALSESSDESGNEESD